MAYYLTPELMTGNTLIDSEHKELFDAINNLLSACQEGKGKTVIASTLDFLASYTAKHFGDEENLQKNCNYYDITNHRHLHDDFKKMVADLQDKLNNKGDTLLMTVEILNVGQWFITHIKTEDKKVAAAIKAANA